MVKKIIVCVWRLCSPRQSDEIKAIVWLVGRKLASFISSCHFVLADSFLFFLCRIASLTCLSCSIRELVRCRRESFIINRQLFLFFSFRLPARFDEQDDSLIERDGNPLLLLFFTHRERRRRGTFGQGSRVYYNQTRERRVCLESSVIQQPSYSQSLTSFLFITYALKFLTVFTLLLLSLLLLRQQRIALTTKWHAWLWQFLPWQRQSLASLSREVFHTMESERSNKSFPPTIDKVHQLFVSFFSSFLYALCSTLARAKVHVRSSLLKGIVWSDTWSPLESFRFCSRFLPSSFRSVTLNMSRGNGKSRVRTNSKRHNSRRHTDRQTSTYFYILFSSGGYFRA